MFTTKHLEANGQTIAKVTPEEITPNEKRLIMEGSLGYCEAHCNLYRKTSQEALRTRAGYGLLRCPVPDLICRCGRCPGAMTMEEAGACKEWS